MVTAVSRAKPGPMGDHHAIRPATMTHNWRVVHFDVIPDPRASTQPTRDQRPPNGRPNLVRATGSVSKFTGGPQRSHRLSCRNGMRESDYLPDRPPMTQRSQAAFDPDTITLLKEVLLQAEETFPMQHRSSEVRAKASDGYPEGSRRGRTRSCTFAKGSACRCERFVECALIPKRKGPDKRGAIEFDVACFQASTIAWAAFRMLAPRSAR